MSHSIEPWLSGPIPGVHPLLAPLFYSFAQAREELAACTEGLTSEQIWSRPHGLTPLGFHVRHAGGAVDRLGTYLRGQQLTQQQLDALKREIEPGAAREELLAQVEESLARCEQYVRSLAIENLTQPREVGRKKLPTTVHGLIVHIAEHTMRHVGQAVTTAKLIRAIADQ